MFGETTISYVKIWNHPIETTIFKWMFQVPGNQVSNFHTFEGHSNSPIKESGFFVRKIIGKPPLTTATAAGCFLQGGSVGVVSCQRNLAAAIIAGDTLN